MTSKHTPGPWRVSTDCSWKFIISASTPVATAWSECNGRLISAAPDLLYALEGLLDDVYGLMRESEGVAGLHLNGDVADWASLDEGGRFERLSSMSVARAAIAKATGES